jgi:dihydroflavonol-4-reductase
MRVAITGAGGFLGRSLTQALLAQGNDVRCLVRRTGPIADGPSQKPEVFLADVGDAASLERAFRGVDVVFHLAGVRRAPSRQLFFQVNAEGTRNVCQAMLEAGAQQMIFCGSLAASGPSTKDRPRVEEDPLSPQEWYGESKAEGERIAFSYRPRLRVSVARPCRILGPGDRENLVFFRLVRKGIRLSIGGGPRPLSLVDVEDVANFLILLAQNPRAEGEAFFVAAPETMTLEDIEDHVAKTLGVVPRTLSVPPFALRTLALLADVASPLLRRRLPLNRKLARQLLAPAWTCSSAKAERLLGFRPTISIADSIDRSAAWYQRHGWV